MRASCLTTRPCASCACVAWAVNPCVAAHDLLCSSLLFAKMAPPSLLHALKRTLCSSRLLRSVRAFTAFDSQSCHLVWQMTKPHCVLLTEVGRKSEVVIGGTSDETFDLHVKCPCFRSEIVKLSLVGLCQTFDVLVKCPLFPSVVIIMLSLRVGKLCMVFQLYPSRNGRNTQLYSDTKDTVIYQC